MNIKAYYLIDVKEEADSSGDIIQTTTERKVYPSISSTRQSEFYQAQAEGFKTEKTITIREFEYKGESKVREDDIVYDILRNFRPGDGKIELVLTKGVNKNVRT